MHHQHEGMQYHDENDNHINDYMEEETHLGEHAFVDENQDGICDLAQDGSPTRLECAITRLECPSD